MGALLPEIFQAPPIALLQATGATAHRAPAINAAGDGWEWRNLADASLLTTGTIPDARISSAIARTSALSGYLPLTGGTLTGNLTLGALATLTAAGNIFTQGLFADTSVSAGYQSGPDAYASLIGPTSGYLRSWNGSSFTSRFGWDTTGIRFFGSSGVAQQAQTVDLKDALVNYGLIGSSAGATPLDLDGGTNTAGLLVALQPGGTAGVDQLELSHDGTSGIIRSRDGAVDLYTPAMSGGCYWRFTGNAAQGQISYIGTSADIVIGAGTLGNPGGGVAVRHVRDSAGNLWTLGPWNTINQLTFGGSAAARDVGVARESANLLKVTDATSSGYGNLRTGRVGINRAPGSGGVWLAIEGTFMVTNGSQTNYYNANGFDCYPTGSAFFRVNGAGQGLYLTTEDPQGIFIRADGTTNRVQFSSTFATFSIPVVLPSLSAAPSGASNGAMYYNTTTHKGQIRANGSWQDLH